MGFIQQRQFLWAIFWIWPAGILPQPLAQMFAKACNISVAPRGVPVPVPCERPDCVRVDQMIHRRQLHSKSDLLHFIENFDDFMGFIGIEATLFIHMVSFLQNSAGVSGAVGEIGVAAGKSFIAMALTRRIGEVLFAVDIFGGGAEPANAAEHLDGQRKSLFVSFLQFANINFSDLVIHHGSSADLFDQDLLSATSGQGFRLFQVDGSHLVENAFHDICIAACSLVDGGVLMIDDVFSAKWMGAAEAFHHFMHVQQIILGPSRRELVPFLYSGRIFLSHRKYAVAYRESLRVALKGKLGEGSMLYGSEVLRTQDLGVYREEYSNLWDEDNEFMVGTSH